MVAAARLHIAEVVPPRRWRRLRCLGLTGTCWLVESEAYPGRLSAYGLDWVRPSPAERDAVHRIIMDELVYGDCTPEAVATLRGIVGRMQAAGCDAVVLACTELPLVIDDAKSRAADARIRRAVLAARASPGGARHLAGIATSPSET